VGTRSTAIMPVRTSVNSSAGAAWVRTTARGSRGAAAGLPRPVRAARRLPIPSFGRRNPTQASVTRMILCDRVVVAFLTR
jgi:hypothetical protein